MTISLQENGQRLENQYFAKRDRELIRQLHAQNDQEEAALPKAPDEDSPTESSSEATPRAEK